jgi:uncharacterized surface protein with fasciclin (FAS1) repeats
MWAMVRWFAWVFTLFYGKVINYSNESLCNLLVLLITKRYLFGMIGIYSVHGGVFVLYQQTCSQQRWSIHSIGDSHMKRQFLKYVLAASAAAALSACGGNDAPAPTKDVVQIAQGDPQFSILVEAVVAADLATTLKSAGPFTVFAPTNAAFAAALTELAITKDALLANKPLLAKILTYHVVPGKIFKSSVPVGTPIKTVQGETFTVDATFAITDQRGRVAKITATDIDATNGVVHVIDKVILPKP